MSNQKSFMSYVPNILKTSTCLYQWCHFRQGHSGSGLTGFWCIIKILPLLFFATLPLFNKYFNRRLCKKLYFFGFGYQLKKSGRNVNEMKMNRSCWKFVAKSNYGSIGKKQVLSILKLCSTSAALMSSIHLSCCGFVPHDDISVGGIGNWRPLDKQSNFCINAQLTYSLLHSFPH